MATIKHLKHLFRPNRQLIALRSMQSKTKIML